MARDPKQRGISFGIVLAWCGLIVAGCSATASTTEGDPGGVPRIDRDRVGVVLIDAQPAFVSMMHGPREPVIERIEQLLILADIGQFPVVATFEHSPERNGWLPPRLDRAFPEHGQKFVKRTFDCCREPEIRAAIEAMEVDQILLAGAETDVCVLQSALGLRALGYEVFLVTDAIFSNEPNIEPAIRRMIQAGVVPVTYKTVYFEIDESVGENALPEAWRIRMRERSLRAVSPYRLTPTAAPPDGQ